MLKIITKTLLLSAVMLGSTSYLMSAADADAAKFVFRYTPGSVTVASGGNGGETTEPEIPVEPEEPETPQDTNLEIGNGNLIHFDANNDGAVNAGDRLTASFPVTNSGDHTAYGLSANNMTFYIESDIYGFHNQFQSDVTCPTTLASKASGDCTASITVTDSMLPPNSKKYYDFKVFLDGFKFTNSGVIDGPYGSDSVNLGSVQDVKLNYAGVSNGINLDFENNEFNIDFYVEVISANDEEFTSPVLNLVVPDLNNARVSVNNCDDYNDSYKVILCRGRLDLTPEMVDKIYSKSEGLYNLYVDVNLESLGGRPKIQSLAVNEHLFEHTMQYREVEFIEPSSVTIINTGSNITNQEITINGLTITNISDGYIRNIDVGVYLGDGADVFVKDICPAASNLKPKQTVNCGQIKYTLNSDQQKVLRDAYGSNRTIYANNQIYLSPKGEEKFDRITHDMPKYDIFIN